MLTMYQEHAQQVVPMLQLAQYSLIHMLMILQKDVFGHVLLVHHCMVITGLIHVYKNVLLILLVIMILDYVFRLASLGLLSMELLNILLLRILPLFACINVHLAVGLIISPINVLPYAVKVLLLIILLGSVSLCVLQTLSLSHTYPPDNAYILAQMDILHLMSVESA